MAEGGIALREFGRPTGVFDVGSERAYGIEPPLPTPAIPAVLAWHTRHDQDAGHRWRRTMITGALIPPALPPGGGTGGGPPSRL